MTDLQAPIYITDAQDRRIAGFEMGGAEGPGVLSLYLNNCDILGVRNIQGGIQEGNRNLDLGAGSTEHPGQIVLNWDVGQGVGIFDGHKNIVAEFNWEGDGEIHFYKPVFFHERIVANKARFLRRIYAKAFKRL